MKILKKGTAVLLAVCAALLWPVTAAARRRDSVTLAPVAGVTFSGADVNSDGTLTIVSGKEMNFTVEFEDYNRGTMPVFGTKALLSTGLDGYWLDVVLRQEDGFYAADGTINQHGQLNFKNAVFELLDDGRDKLIFRRRGVCEGYVGATALNVRKVAYPAAALTKDRVVEYYDSTIYPPVEWPRAYMRLDISLQLDKCGGIIINSSKYSDGSRYLSVRNTVKAENGRLETDFDDGCSMVYTVSHDGRTVGTQDAMEGAQMLGRRLAITGQDCFTEVSVQSCVMGFSAAARAGTSAGTIAIAATATAAGLGVSTAGDLLNNFLQNVAYKKRRLEEITDDIDLPLDDSDLASLEIFRPCIDIVNTKGAAVDLPLTVNGPAGLDWHFIPTAICPDGLKAVVPAVAGIGSQRSLVLAITGAEMKKPSADIFITVVAWARGADGKILKATAVTEMKIHRPGIEATKDKKGNIIVKSYTDSNLNGIAEVKTLTRDEYTLTRQGDNTVITALDKTLGECVLQP